MNTEIFLPFLLETLGKSVLILAGAALIDRLWPRASSPRRHLVWCAALAVVFLLPLTRLVEPHWNVPLQRVTVELPPPKPGALSIIAPGPAPGITVAPAPSAPRWWWPAWEQIAVGAWAAGAGWCYSRVCSAACDSSRSVERPIRSSMRGCSVWLPRLSANTASGVESRCAFRRHAAFHSRGGRCARC